MKLILLIFIISSSILAQESTEKEILKRVDSIGEKIEVAASKLGIAAEHLWKSLIKQQIYNGYASFIAISIPTLLILIILVISCGKPFLNNKNEVSGFGGIRIAATVALFIMLIILTSNLSTWITKINNPEYHASKEVIDLIK